MEKIVVGDYCKRGKHGGIEYSIPIVREVEKEEYDRLRAQELRRAYDFGVWLAGYIREKGIEPGKRKEG